jgi:hypothetical protein
MAGQYGERWCIAISAMKSVNVMAITVVITLKAE